MKNIRGILNELANNVMNESLSSTDRRELQDSIDMFVDEAMESIQEVLQTFAKKQ